MRYAADDQSQERHLIRCLKGNIIKRLREAHMMMSTERDWTLSQHKEYLTRIDFYQRLNAEEEAQALAHQKTNAFAKQYAKTRLEVAYKDRGKYTIISRSDSNEYRRWDWEDLGGVNKVVKIAPQPEAESYINQAYWHSAPLRGLIPSEQHIIWIQRPKSVISSNYCVNSLQTRETRSHATNQNQHTMRQNLEHAVFERFEFIRSLSENAPWLHFSLS